MVTREIHCSIGGVVQGLEVIENRLTYVALEPIPGNTWVGSKVPFAARLEEVDFLGKQVDIENIISGIGMAKVINSVIESADYRTEAEMPFSYFKALALSKRDW